MEEEEEEEEVQCTQPQLKDRHTFRVPPLESDRQAGRQAGRPRTL